MKRRDFVLLTVAGMMAPLPARAQSGRKRRVGWLEPGRQDTFAKRRVAFLDELSKAGYVEGKNLAMEFTYANGKIETLPALAKEVLSRKPECVVALGIDSIRAVRDAAPSTLPIVMGTIDADPIAEGLVAGLARPGGNITGMIGIAWELAGKRLELLREVSPRVKRIAVLYDPRSPAGHAHLKQTEAAARTLKMDLRVVGIQSPDEIDGAFRAAREWRADALFVIAVGMINAHRPHFAALAVDLRLPAIYSNVEFAADGGLMSYGPEGIQQYRRVANYVDKILKGVNPAELPIEQARVFELVVNLRTAKRIGLQIPRSIVARADRVIE